MCLLGVYSVTIYMTVIIFPCVHYSASSVHVFSLPIFLAVCYTHTLCHTQRYCRYFQVVCSWYDSCEKKPQKSLQERAVVELKHHKKLVPSCVGI